MRLCDEPQKIEAIEENGGVVHGEAVSGPTQVMREVYDPATDTESQHIIWYVGTAAVAIASCMQQDDRI